MGQRPRRVCGAGAAGGGADGGGAAPCCGGSWRCSVTPVLSPRVTACSTRCARAGGRASTAPGKGRGRGRARGGGPAPAQPHPRPRCCRAECQEQVNKFPSASFKKFATEKDAWAFVRAGLPGQPQPQPAGSSSSPGLYRCPGGPPGWEGGREGGGGGGGRPRCGLAQLRGVCVSSAARG